MNNRAKSCFCMCILLTFIFTCKFARMSNKNMGNAHNIYSRDLFDTKKMNEGQNIRCCEQGPYMLVLIPTMRGSTEERHSIRGTWMNQEWANLDREHTIRHIFLVGKSGVEQDELPVTQEIKMNQDILVGNFRDSPENLALQILFGMNWIYQYCKQIKYVMKVADDTLVLLPNLLVFLKENQIENRIIGRVIEDGEVKRRGHLKVDRELYSFSKYPPYTDGGLYIIPMTIIKDILTVSLQTKMIPIEDAYITGIIRRKARVNLINHRGFTTTSKNIKLLTKDTFSISNIGPLKMLEVWNLIKYWNTNRHIDKNIL